MRDALSDQCVYLCIHVVNQSRLWRKHSHCSGENNEVSEEEKQRSQESAERDIRRALDQPHGYAIERPFMASFLTEGGIHELVNVRAINL